MQCTRIITLFGSLFELIPFVKFSSPEHNVRSLKEMFLKLYIMTADTRENAVNKSITMSGLLVIIIYLFSVFLVSSIAPKVNKGMATKPYHIININTILN